jgi:hypothetical protein
VELIVDKNFYKLLEGLHKKYELLISMVPVTVDTVPPDAPNGGVYLFSENGSNMYAGRTKHKINDRLKNHVSTADDCPFAWRLACDKTGKKANYQKGNTRKDLLKDPTFKKEYEVAKRRIRQMQVRFVGESDPVAQALLEIYVAIVSGALHNHFDT